MPTEDSSRAWPPFLAPMRGLLEKASFPEGPFDPLGAWEHHYAVCALTPERRAAGENPRPYGTLALTRTPAAGGQFTLGVDFSVTTRAQSGWRTHAEIICATDRLATPTKWELRSAPLEETPASGFTETAVYRSGIVTRSGRVQRKLAMPGPYTSNWSLMEAVQRLPFTEFAPLDFEMLEDLDERKPGQSLKPAGEFTLDLASKPVRLHAFRQIGRGILPIHYWVDDRHRLLAVSGGLRGFVWGPAATRPRKEKA